MSTGFVYCLYSTGDGDPRYVSQEPDKVSYQFKQHVTAALEKEPGILYDWMRDVWRSGLDVGVYILQDNISPSDLEVFERYWIEQFANLLNRDPRSPPTKDSSVAQQIKVALRAQLQSPPK